MTRLPLDLRAYTAGMVAKAYEPNDTPDEITCQGCGGPLAFDGSPCGVCVPAQIDEPRVQIGPLDC